MVSGERAMNSTTLLYMSVLIINVDVAYVLWKCVG